MRGGVRLAEPVAAVPVDQGQPQRHPPARGPAARGVPVTHVFETHIHNDYVSGGLALARRSGAAYHVNAADQVASDRVGISDGDAVAVGELMRVR